MNTSTIEIKMHDNKNVITEEVACLENVDEENSIEVFREDKSSCRSLVFKIVSLERYISLLSGEAKIGLPKFQRDAVWDPQRVETLWDSIFRGFSISSMILAKATENIKLLSRSRSDQKEIYKSKANNIKYVLLDGQQRSNAILLGFSPTQNERIWIDINKSFLSRNSVYLCNKAHPWGFHADKIQIEKAREKLFAGKGGPRDADFQLSLESTWPADANFPVPLDEFISWCKKPIKLKSLVDLIPKKLFNQCDILKEICRRRFNIRLWRINILFCLTNYFLPLVFMNNQSNFYEKDLGELFARLNKQGMSMSGEDLFFSALKIELPEAHDLVWEAYSNEKIGKMLPPSKLVHIAARIIAKNLDLKTQLDSVSSETLRLLMNENKKFLDTFKDYLYGKRFLSIFLWTRKLIDWKDEDSSNGRRRANNLRRASSLSAH